MPSSLSLVKPLLSNAECPTLQERAVLYIIPIMEDIIIVGDPCLRYFCLAIVVMRQSLHSGVVPHFLHPGQCIGAGRIKRQVVGTEALRNSPISNHKHNPNDNQWVYTPKEQAKRRHPRY